MTICRAGTATGSTAAALGTPARVEWHLDNWRRWKRTGGHQGAYGHCAVGLSSGGNSQDFDDMAEQSDRRCAGIVDTLIDDLSPAQSCAIYAEYLHSVFRFPRGNFDQLIDSAKVALGRGLAMKGVY